MRAEIVARFEALVDRSGGPDACHPWKGSTNDKGYGWFGVDGKTRKAQRATRLATKGE